MATQVAPPLLSRLCVRKRRSKAKTGTNLCQLTREGLGCLWVTWVISFSVFLCVSVCVRESLWCPGVMEPVVVKNTHLAQSEHNTPRCAPVR